MPHTPYPTNAILGGLKAQNFSSIVRVETKKDGEFDNGRCSPDMANRTYAILGTGAVGGFYGARLQKAGLDVRFLLHSDYEHVRQHGLVVESPEGDFTLSQVKAYRNADEMPRCDVVVIALKSTR